MADEVNELTASELIELRPESFDEGIVAVHADPVILNVDLEERVEVSSRHGAVLNLLSSIPHVLVQESNEDTCLPFLVPELLLVLVIDEVDDLGIAHCFVIGADELIQLFIVFSKPCLVDVFQPLKLSQGIVSGPLLFADEPI